MTSHKFHQQVDVLERTTSFEIQRDILTKLFEPDNIKDGHSMKMLKDYGGVQGLIQKLRTDIRNGLNNDSISDLEERGKEYGRNDPILKKTKGFWEFAWEAFSDLMLRIITVAAILSIILGVIHDPAHGWMEGFTILFAVVIIIVVTAGNNYLKEKQFEKLYRKTDDRKVEVYRNGKPEQLSVYKLMVGDIVTVQIGDILPVDGILCQGSTIYMDESSVTGESDLIQKEVPETYSEKKTPVLISGSKVMDGSGLMVIGAVGIYTQNGKLKLKLQEEAAPTPLQCKLDKVATDLGKIGLFIALLTMAVMIMHLLIAFAKREKCFICMESAQFLIVAILTCVAIVVMAVPEGLPLAVTITLAYSVNKMKDENNLVRQLQSCEIMGGANNICSDKTGTLTQNRMKVTNLYIAENEYTTEGFTVSKIGQENVELLCESMCVNSSANPQKNKDGVFEQLGNKTECALIELADTFGYKYQTFRTADKIKKVVPFNSTRKKMITVYQKETGKYRIYVKGAPEFVMEGCVDYVRASGKAKLDSTVRAHIQDKVIENFASKSLRTILLAYRDVDSNPSDWSEEKLAEGLTIIGITGIKDPLRPEIVDAVKKCKKAGIMVRMVTGDNYNTAVAIAKECGILDPDFKGGRQGDYTALEGKKFREIVGGIVYETIPGKEQQVSKVGDIKKFEEVAKQLRVLARSTPDDKYLLVTGLIQLQNVIAVTGDGTNDAPALKKADVGFAMGIAGTEVAKEAAGIILLDDNFNSIVTACKWGRNIYDCIRKFIQFQLSISITALTMAFIGAVSISESPLTPIQILWVNLIMDTFAALALATEPPTDDLLNRKPYSRNEYIVTPNMWRGILAQVVYQITILCIILFGAPKIFGIENGAGASQRPWSEPAAVHFTIFFHTFVLCQLVNEVNCRKLKKSEINVFKNMCNNPTFWAIEVFQVLVQILLVQFGGMFVRCAPLSIMQHVYCFAFAFGSLIIGFIVKIIPEAVYNQCVIFKEISDWENPEELKTPLKY